VYMPAVAGPVDALASAIAAIHKRDADCTGQTPLGRPK